MSQHAFWTGLGAGVVLGVALAFGAFYVPHRGLGLAGEPLRVDALFDSAHGLRAGSPVQVQGIEAGRVESVQLVEVPALGYRVAVRLALDEPERFSGALTERVDVRVAREALLGEVVVALSPRTGGAALRTGSLVEGHGPASTEGIVEDAAAIARRLRDFLDGTQPGDPSLRRALQYVEDTLERLRNFAARLPQ